MAKSKNTVGSYRTFVIPGIEEGTSLVIAETPERRELLISIASKNDASLMTIRFNKEQWVELCGTVNYHAEVNSITEAVADELDI